MIIHYNCTSFLFHSFLLIYHPYPPSFQLLYLFLVEANLESQGEPKILIHAYITYACALAQTALSLVTRQWRLSKTVLAACRFIPTCFDRKVQNSVGQKAHRLECTESIYVKTTDATCVRKEIFKRRCWDKL